jgi:hypothetical protein
MFPHTIWIRQLHYDVNASDDSIAYGDISIAQRQKISDCIRRYWKHWFSFEFSVWSRLCKMGLLGPPHIILHHNRKVGHPSNPTRTESTVVAFHVQNLLSWRDFLFEKLDKCRQLQDLDIKPTG